MRERSSAREELLSRRRRNRKRLALGLGGLAIGALALVYGLARDSLDDWLWGAGTSEEIAAADPTAPESSKNRASPARERADQSGRRAGRGAEDGAQAGGSVGGGGRGADLQIASPGGSAPTGAADPQAPEQPGEEGLLDPITGLLPEEVTELLGEAEGLLEDPPLPDLPADPTGELLQGLAPEDLAGGLPALDETGLDEPAAAAPESSFEGLTGLDPGSSLEGLSAAGVALEGPAAGPDPAGAGDLGGALGVDPPADLGNNVDDVGEALDDLGGIPDLDP